MNIKRVLGLLLTLIGLGGIIYAATLLMHTSGGGHDIKSLFIYGGLGLIFFTSGMGLIRTIKDEA